MDEETENTQPGSGNDSARGGAPAPAPAADVAAAAQGAALEQARVSGIMLAFAPHDERRDVRQLMQQCIGDGECTVATATQRLNALLGAEAKPVGGDVRITADARDKLRAGMLQVLHQRAHTQVMSAVGRTPKLEQLGRELPAIDGANEFRSMNLEMMARACIRAANLSEYGTRMQVLARAFESTSDFPSILADVANKSLMSGFDAGVETHRDWTQLGDLSDFKPHLRAALGAFDALPNVLEHGEYDYATISDRGEYIQAAKYGHIFAVTLEAIINDDLAAFTQVPAQQGAAAMATEANLVYAVLTTNGAMGEDNVALFHATHGNLLTGGDAGAPSISTVGKMRVAMQKQKATSTAATTLGIRLRYLLVPLELEDTARTLQVSEFDPAPNASLRAANIVRNSFQTIAERRLSSDSASKWYAAAERRTIEVSHIDGQRSPVLESMSGWKIDGMEFKVRHIVGVKALDWRTLARNDG